MVFNINSKSWHYRLAKKYGDWVDYDPEYHPEWMLENNNLCEYMKEVFKGASIVAVITLVLSFLLIIYGNLLMGTAFSVYYGVYLLNEAAHITLGVTIAIIIAVAFIALWLHAIQSYRNRDKKKDGFIMTAFKSWKNKYCLKVNVIHE